MLCIMLCQYLDKQLKFNFHKGDSTLKNRQTITIIENISKQHTSPAEQRAFEKAIAALQYCGNLTYYTETKRFGDKPDMREKIREYINELDLEIDRLENLLKNTDRPYDLQIKGRLNTIIEAKNDLLGRLKEVV